MIDASDGRRAAAERAERCPLAVRQEVVAGTKAERDSRRAGQTARRHEDIL